MSCLYKFELWVEVDDADELRRAAIERWHEENPSIEDPYEGGFDPDDEAHCIVMLLDPSTMPGCTIESSSCEHMSLLGNDENKWLEA